MHLCFPKTTIWRWLLLSFVSAYVVLCFVLFFTYVKPSLLGTNSLRIGADSATYLVAAGVIQDNRVAMADVQLVSFEGNFFGPVLIARLIPSLLGIAILDIAIFIATLWIAWTLPGVRLGKFFWLIVVNPLTTPSLLTLNKEILSFLAIMLLMKYISSENRSRLLLIAALLTSIMARWEQMAVTLLFLALESRWSPLRGRPWRTLILMVLGITLIYPLLVNTAVVNIAALIAGAEGNLMPRLNEIQAHYGFPLIVGPKIMMNLWGQVMHPSYFWTDYLHGDFTDLQNYFAIPFHCVAMFVVSILAIFRKKLTVHKQSLYWVAIYAVATAATPLFQPRYQFAVYIVLCLEISGYISPTVGSKKATLRERRLLHLCPSLRRI